MSFSFCSGLLLGIVVLFLTGCFPATTPVEISAPHSPQLGASQTGVASWYGPGFHGHPTASGEIYDQFKLTAAHRTLPLGSRVIITNLHNGRSLEVSINDRGPFAKRRILDLSYAAARVLGVVGPGTAQVRLEVIESPTRVETIRQNLDYTLQAGSFSDLENARKLRDRLGRSEPRVPQITIVPFRGKVATYYRVQVGTFSSRSEAERQARRLARNGFRIIIMEK
ncbi:MAG: septal ring lytic transglycosylase RlpA family protein [Candidatus Binatia bacterium]|jgi:rare lipoprotein A|nr:septal ring lytic transglycosylase RlpA family protein [Candidatus Binatia bacterium]